MNLRRFLSGILLGILCLFLFAGPSLAIGNPDTISIGDAYVFRDVIEEGDQLYFVRYDVSYDPVPEEDPEDTWQVALYDSLGELIATRPLNYYQHNIIAIYLTASQALEWGEAHLVRVMGMPSVFGTLVEGTNMRTRTLGPGDYEEAEFLGGIMLTQAGILEDDWEIDLLDSEGLLNTTGSTFFLQAVPGLSAMVPEIFSVTSSQVNPDYTSYNQTYREDLRNNAGDRVQDVLDGFTAIVPVSDDWMSFWLIILGFCIFAGVIFSGLGNPGWAMAGGFPFIVGGAYLMGGEIFTFTAVVVIIVAVIFGIYFILGRFS